MSSEGTSATRSRETLKEQRILEAACFEFSRRGFGGGKVRRIAERAGVGHPLINYYFGDKDGLWRAAAEHLYGGVVELIDELLSEAARLEDGARLRLVLVEFVVACSQSRFLSFMVESLVDGGDRAAWLRDRWMRPVEERIYRVISDAQECGVLASGNPDLIYRLLTGFSMSGGALELLGATPSPARTRRGAEELISFLTRAR